MCYIFLLLLELLFYWSPTCASAKRSDNDADLSGKGEGKEEEYNEDPEGAAIEERWRRIMSAFHSV